MRKLRILKVTLAACIGLIVLTVAFSSYKYFTITLPDKEVGKAIEALAAAKNARAQVFAGEKLSEADKVFDQAMQEWKAQNKKFLLFRDFTRVKELANLATLLGNEGWNQAIVEKTSESNNLEKRLSLIEKQLDDFVKYFKNLPLGRTTFTQYSAAQIKYNEATNYFREGQFNNAVSLANEATELLSQASLKAHQMLRNFYNDYPKWKKDAEFARLLASQGRTIILISKLESSCMILKAGKTIGNYDAEFGFNWLGDKKYMGDKATPEGIYSVTEKKSGIRTRYYKSLLLNYPNEDDKKRFSELRKRGSIPVNSKIGGQIEIHGYGGKGVNWTDGCIALQNKDMDKIYELCMVDTPVIIIGTELPLSEFLK